MRFSRIRFRRSKWRFWKPDGELWRNRAQKKYHPESVVDAQFSMPFGAAVAVLCGAAGLDQFTLEQIRSPRVHRMMGKVVLVKDARIEETFPREWPARVAIRAR